MNYMITQHAAAHCSNHCRRSCVNPAAAAATGTRAVAAQLQPSRHTCNRCISVYALQPSEPVVPDNVNLDDPELQAQITALLKDLDPDLLLDDTEQLISGVATAAAASQAKRQAGNADEQYSYAEPSDSSSNLQASAWQEEEGDEETEAGLPEGVVLTRAAYKRKAAVLVELMAAQQSEAAEEVLAQKLSAFRVEIDEALLHMLSKRVQAAQTHEQDSAALAQLQELHDLLSLEYERSQATPALRLLDEVLDLLGNDPYMPGGHDRGEAVVQRLRKAFTGGVAEDVDIFAAAAALAADKALAAEALAVEYVPQASFLAEGMELLQAAKDEMEQLALAVTQAQAELQQVRNTQPELLNSPEAQDHIRQVAAADEVLQRRKAAVAQLTYVLQVAQDLDAAERSFAASRESSRQQASAAPGDLPSPEDLAALLGIE